MGCEGGVGKAVGHSMPWLEALYLNLASGSTTYVAADAWLDCRDWLDAWLELEWVGANGNNVTVTLQTAPALTVMDDTPTGWQDVTSTATLGTTSVQVFKAPRTATVPIMGVMRLKFVASGATVTGALRVTVTFKGRA